jgi:beta-galactosidase/beta-glucuronidase
VATGQGVTGTPFNVTIPNMRLWSPNDPFQYDLEINVTKNGTKVSPDQAIIIEDPSEVLTKVSL